MSRHNYTNPAFCQQSEYYASPSSTNQLTANNGAARAQRSESMRSSVRSMRNLHSTKTSFGPKQPSTAMQHRQSIQQRELPPKPGPKPRPNAEKNCTEGYALVPLAELPGTSKGRYAVVPADEAKIMRSKSMMRLTRSRDNLDLSPGHVVEEENSFTSLPALTAQDNDYDEKGPLAEHLALAFSSNFISDSMILVNQNGLQRYAIVPTDDDEEIVDNNHEIIQMNNNGRAHRYAVIPTDEEETCLSDEVEMDSYPVAMQSKPTPFTISTARRNAIDYGRQSMSAMHTKSNAKLAPSNAPKMIRPPDTPTKNPIATQKLHELLSTPRKTEMLQRHGSYHTIVQKSPEHRYRSQIICSTPKQREFAPQKLQYEPHVEQRTTAIISPRLHQQTIYNETTNSSGFDTMHESFHKIEKATATIGLVSLMLLLAGTLNSGLCLYMVTIVSATNPPHKIDSHKLIAHCR